MYSIKRAKTKAHCGILFKQRTYAPLYSLSAYLQKSAPDINGSKNDTYNTT